MKTATQSGTSIDDVVECGGLVAWRIADDLSWGEGDIRPSLGQTAADERMLIEAVLASVEPVAETEAAYSTCTDGRLPVRLKSGDKIPVREQMVGADTVSAFYVAECLGSKFYRDLTASAVERVIDVAHFLHENGLLPSSHVACGAASGFVTIVQNVIRFSRNPHFIARLQTLLPAGVFDADLHAQMLKDSQKRLAAGAYEGLAADTFLAVAENLSGRRAIAELRDDGRGVHGHVEEAIMRIHWPGMLLTKQRLPLKRAAVKYLA